MQQQIYQGVLKCTVTYICCRVVDQSHNCWQSRSKWTVGYNVQKTSQQEAKKHALLQNRNQHQFFHWRKLGTSWTAATLETLQRISQTTFCLFSVQCPQQTIKLYTLFCQVCSSAQGSKAFKECTVLIVTVSPQVNKPEKSDRRVKKKHCGKKEVTMHSSYTAH